MLLINNKLGKVLINLGGIYNSFEVSKTKNEFYIKLIANRHMTRGPYVKRGDSPDHKLKSLIQY